MAGYHFRWLPQATRTSVQLNIFNVFDKRDPLITRLRADGIGVVRSMPPAPMTWRLTTNVEF